MPIAKGFAPSFLAALDNILHIVYTVYYVYSVYFVNGDNMTEPTRREKQREETLAEIKEVARRQMSEVGTAAISLRAIAREMGMTAPALYRYYDSRDALVTELIIDAYNALATAMITADQGQERGDYAARFLAVAAAFHAWAIAHPEDYKLIYGTPIPGYHAPRERTVEPAGRVQMALGMVLTEALLADKATIPAAYTNLPPDVQGVLDALLSDLPPGVPAAGVALSIIIWSTWHGLVWGEIAGHVPPGLAGTGELFQLEAQAMVDRLKLGTE